MNEGRLKEKSQGGDQWRPPIWVGLLWGFAEGTFFFVIPDVILSWAALSGVKCGTKMLGAIVAGSLVAGICMYGWASADPAGSQSAVASVPFVRKSMFETVEAGYREHGAGAMLRGPSSGIPYKVYGVLAPPVMGPIKFLVMSVPARLERLVLSWVVFSVLGLAVRRWGKPSPRWVAGLFGGFWLVVYGFYWSRF